VTVKGVVTVLKRAGANTKKPYTNLTIKDGDKELKVFFEGHLDLDEGDKVLVTGEFREGQQNSLNASETKGGSVLKRVARPVTEVISELRRYFIGTWKVGARSGTLVLTEERAVYGKMVGRWAVIGNQVLIDWKDGSHNAIRNRGGKLVLVTFTEKGTTGVPINRDWQD
jgi:hypothetical protein